MWKNIVESGSPKMTILWRQFPCWIIKATNTHSECVILIDFPLQQWLHERATVLRYVYTACIAFFRTRSILFSLRQNISVVQQTKHISSRMQMNKQSDRKTDTVADYF